MTTKLTEWENQTGKWESSKWNFHLSLHHSWDDQWIQERVKRSV